MSLGGAERDESDLLDRSFAILELIEVGTIGGIRMQNYDPNQYPAPNQEQKPPRTKKGRWKDITIAILAVALIGSLMSNDGSADPRSSGAVSEESSKSTMIAQENAKPTASTAKTTPTTAPTATPKPTSTPKPTATPVPTVTPTPTLSVSEKAEFYSKGIYKDYARDPDDYFLDLVQIKGKVLQVISGSDHNAYRIAQNDNYDEVWYVEYTPAAGESRILEDDMVTIYGIYYGIMEYETVLGSTMAIPAILAENIILD